MIHLRTVLSRPTRRRRDLFAAEMMDVGCWPPRAAKSHEKKMGDGRLKMGDGVTHKEDLGLGDSCAASRGD